MAYTSRIANELLVTPFDDKSVVSEEISNRLTEEEFCNHCYTHPKFEQNSQTYESEETKENDIDSPTNFDEYQNQIHQQKVSYDNFELWLNNFENSKVYTINGNAGTGKTTFINYKRINEKNNKWIILDVHLARSFDEWFSDIRTDISHFEQAQSKVYGSIMNKLWELLFQGVDKEDNYSPQIVSDNLIKLTKNYKRNFASRYPSGKKILNALCEVFEKETDNVVQVEKSAEIFKTYIDGKIGIEGNEIIDILNIFILVLRCLSDNKNERFIIFFDNFERFIAKDELYNRDVDKIRLLLTSYTKAISQKGNCHRGFIKFALAVRDSTARMCGVRLHASDAEAYNLDLGKWYDTQEIISSKKKWYMDNQIPIEGFDIVEQIIGDLRMCSDHTITGLKLLIDPLFNNNKRLIIDFIGSMVELPGNSTNIKTYQYFWSENTSNSRFVARSIIRGMILNELEEKPDKLFEHLRTYSTKSSINGVGEARKILTILYNNIYKGNENEMQMTSLLSELFGVSDIESVWSDKRYKKKVKSISEILYYMNSYNRRENDWIQFIDLQFQKSSCDIVVEDADKLEEVLKNNMKNCMVHLMPAGKAYLLYIVASFEFFSLRYTKNYAPLFTLIPTPDEIKEKNSVKELPCYEKIECVVKFALKCIETLKNGEDSIKLYIGNSKDGIYHYTRIINQHKAYIESFNTYIRNQYCNSDELDEKIRNKYKALYKEITVLSNLYGQNESNTNKYLRR